MKNIIVVLLLFFSLLGCSQQSVNVEQSTRTYTGESEQWIAEYTLTKAGNGVVYEEGYLEYKGENKNQVGQIHFELISDHLHTEGTLTYHDKKMNISGDSSKNAALPTIDEIINVKIEWNGQTEKFTLKSKSK